ncbi:MAG: hypothetical protein QM530_09355 [Phycisphaerales bacterium]|nr:hypothetical protein [Phycisphaerales bacterium]
MPNNTNKTPVFAKLYAADKKLLEKAWGYCSATKRGLYSPTNSQKRWRDNPIETAYHSA